MTIHLLHQSQPGLPQAAMLAMADSLDACTAVVDHSGKIVGFTEAWSSFRGLNPLLAEMKLGSSYLDACRRLAHSPDGNISIVALGLVSVMEGRVNRLVFDYPFQEEDGPHDYGCTARLRSSDEHIQAVIHIRDISERTALMRRMRRSDRLFKATTDNAMDFICLLDTGSRMVYHNLALERFLGHTETWSPDQKMVDFVHEEDRDLFLGSLRTGAQAGLTKVFEYRLCDAQGGWREVEGQISAVEDPGAVSDSVLLISRDISLRKQMEKERAKEEVELRHAQKLQAIGQLAAGIAHEINTPIQYIGDNTTFLQDAFTQAMTLVRTLQAILKEIQGDGCLATARATQGLEALEAADTGYLEEEIPKAIQQTLEGVARVSKIVSAMKDFSHPGGESASWIDLRKAIESTLTVSQGEWKSVAQVETDFAKTLPMVPCFPGEINQVVLNLLINAAHAISARQEQTGSVELGLIKVGTRLHGDEAELWVSDNGTGIPASIQSRIFEPFFTTKTVGKGSGQGLSIVHAVITQKHKGRIVLESTPMVGTTFRVFLPLNPDRS